MRLGRDARASERTEMCVAVAKCGGQRLRAEHLVHRQEHVAQRSVIAGKLHVLRPAFTQLRLQRADLLGLYFLKRHASIIP
eukprot:355645-Chlamydomonas_euryale.AAC.42